MSVDVTQLANGVRVVSERMDSVESVTTGVWIGAGTRDEARDTSGAAHFLEHMAFKGTHQRTAFDIARAVEDVGGHINAYTSRETTVYYARTLRPDMSLGVDILSDILQNSLFDASDLDRERDVILQEIAMCADTPDDRVFDYFQERAFPAQAMGWPVLGHRDTVRALSRQNLCAFMQTHYGPQRMIVAACGRVEHRSFVDTVSRVFGDVPPATPPTRQAASYQGGIDIHDKKDLEQLHVVLGFKGVSYTDADYYALALAAGILGGGMSSRLFQEVREKRGLAYSVHSFSASYTDGGIFGVYAGTGAEKGEELLATICEELARAASTIDSVELERAKTQLKAGLLMALESTHQRCEQACQQMLVYGRPLSVNEVIARIDDVRKEDIAAVLARTVTTNPTLSVLGSCQDLSGVETILGRLS